MNTLVILDLRHFLKRSRAENKIAILAGKSSRIYAFYLKGFAFGNDNITESIFFCGVGNGALIAAIISLVNYGSFESFR